LRCGRCGNENAAANRFCGMCGASLVAAAAGGGQSAGQVPAAPPEITAPKAAAVPVRPVPPVAPAARDAGPVITGPSFLGLSTPGPYVERHADQHADREAEAHVDRHAEGHEPLRPSSNLDYLLEDEEEEPKRSSGKLILIALALALAVGFGYLHWKQGGFDWLNQSDKKPATAAKVDSGQSGTDSASGADGATAANGAPAATLPGSGTADSAAGSPASSTPTSAVPSSDAPSSAPPVTASPDAASQAASSQTSPVQSSATQNAASPTPAADPNLTPSSAAPAADSETAAPAVVPRAVARKPSPAKPAKPFDPVSEGERYIYGRGVRQDCDHGLRLVKTAAEQSNSKAMISLGALYSTGTCTPRDLPTAYRWFALALHKEPDNQALQGDLQKLWAKMTQPERQLAIKLSQ
jgi:Sel1 repeat-containing protein